MTAIVLPTKMKDCDAMRKILLAIMICVSMVLAASAHSGGTDANGGHVDHSTGEYHYHHGYPAHQHYDMNGDGIKDCPYEFRWNTNSSSSGWSDLSDDEFFFMTVHKAYENGFDIGRAEGYKDGYDAGYKRGERDGYNNGKNDGKRDGLEAGYRNGYSAAMVVAEEMSAASYSQGESDATEKYKAELEKVRNDNRNTLIAAILVTAIASIVLTALIVKWPFRKGGGSCLDEGSDLEPDKEQESEPEAEYWPITYPEPEPVSKHDTYKRRPLSGLESMRVMICFPVAPLALTFLSWFFREQLEPPFLSSSEYVVPICAMILFPFFWFVARREYQKIIQNDIQGGTEDQNANQEYVLLSEEDAEIARELLEEMEREK